jgi:hypothetical protein
MSEKRIPGIVSVWIILGFIPLIQTGCSVDYFRAETILHSDGSVDRAIYQPRGETPKTVNDPEIWKSVTWSDEIKTEDWRGSIRDLPLKKKHDDLSYFAAWNRFPSAAEILDHYVRKSPDGSREVKLERYVTRNDFAFVTEHIWYEVLTDVVTLEDMHKARKELADFLIPSGRDVLQEALGEEYDVSALVKLFRGEGFEWFCELTDLFYDMSAGRGTFPEKKLEQRAKCRFEKICRKHGLEISEDGNQKILREFAEKKLLELVRQKNGKPLSEENLKMILDDFFPRNENGENKKNSRLEKAAEKVIAQKHGCQKDFKLKLDVLISRIFGVHHTLFRTPKKFDYSLTMPGTIFETNGAILSDNKVRWSFEPEEAYPLGYSMRCRSWEPNSDLQKKLLGKPLLLNREKIQAFLSFVSGDDELQKALNQCKSQQSLKPLKQHRREFESNNNAENSIDIARDRKLRKLKQLWKLLELNSPN